MKKNKIFTVKSLHSIVKELGLAELRNWRYDSGSWIGNSPVFEFGKGNPENLSKCSIAFYIEGKNRNTVDEFKIVLNINNPKIKDQALSYFDILISDLFNLIGLDYSINIKTAIREFKYFQEENIIVDTSEISEIDTIKLILLNK